MTGAMYAAVSGLQAHMSALNVIGNNVANINTLGYKSTRYTFNEALYSSIRYGSDGSETAGGLNPAQLGYGCSLGTVDVDMSTKNYSPTGKALDTMIDGDGFFIVGDNKNRNVTTQSQLQGMTLTRLGNFSFDAQGFLVDGEGSLVYGFLRLGEQEQLQDGSNVYTEQELTSPILTPIRFPMSLTTEETTTDPQTNETTTILRTEIRWPNVVGTGDAQRVVDNDAGATDAEGNTVYPTRMAIDSVSIDEKSGKITAVTNDEQMIVVGYLAVGTVDNPDGVTHIDGRYYRAEGGAGTLSLTTIGGVFVRKANDEENAEAITGVDGKNMGTSLLTVDSSGGTQLVGGGLESSGTDLAMEISNMIVIQRGYQANTRIISVTDSMLEELVNIKR